MVFARRLAFVLSISAMALGCQPKPEVAPEPGKKSAKKEGAKTEKGDKKAASKEHAEAPVDPGKFIVPFAWEAAKDEPLAQTRAFLRDLLTDNEGYMEHGDKFFAAFADKQTPRATIVTCADSRVHNQAWDVTPENDDFTIRNIGNQIENAEGSVEYGIEHLHTPLLMVVGHTGCGAVKAAMGDISKLSAPIQKELQHLHIPKPTPGKSPEAAWAEGVIANVNNQVELGLRHFGRQVQAGELTIVGAVYDFRNDLQRGAGRLAIVNVNGNSEPERMTAFVEAVASSPAAGEREPKDKKRKGGGRDETSAAAEEIADQIAKLRGPSARGAPAPKAEAKPAPHDDHDAHH